MLAEPHMTALTSYVRLLAAQGRGAVPDFDPLDGGVQASLLLLLEKPGPRVLSSGAGFVSRDNDTETARTIRDGMMQAGMPRGATVIWNVVPWWNGTMAARVAEKQAGAEELRALLTLLPDLRCVVMAGNTARDFAAPQLAGRGLTLFTCVHPSPQSRAGPASAAAWRELPAIWRRAWLSVS